MHKTNRNLLCSTAVIALAMSLNGAAYAQDTATTASAADDTTVVVVTGIRASIGKSVNDKRKSGKIIDTINAEDIGKSTDQNIAEALNRISGVSMSTSNGEGTTISVRGANADQTVVTLNGSALGSTGFSQGVDLSAYSADILSKVEVIKTPSADDEEGSLAAVVNLQTRKPLDLKKNISTATVQQRFNDLSGKMDHKLSATFSRKFFDNRLGIIATIYDESDSVRRDDIFNENYNTFGTNAYTDQNGKAFASQKAIDADLAAATANGRAPAFAGVTGVAAAGPYTAIATGLAPTTSGYSLNQNNNTRRGLDFTAQWQPSDRTDITVYASYNQQKFRNSTSSVFVTNSNFGNEIDGVQQPNLGLGVNFRNRSTAYDANTIAFGGTVAAAGNPVTNPTSNDGLMWTDPVQNWRTLDTATRTYTKYLDRFSTGGTRSSVNNYSTKNMLVNAEIKHRFTENLTGVFGGSYSKSEQLPEQNIYISTSGSRTVGPWNLHHVPADILQPAGYDCTTGACHLMGGTVAPNLGVNVEINANQNDLWDNVGTSGFNPDDLPSQTLNYLQSTVTTVTDKQQVLFADFDWNTDFAGITKFKFGAKYTARDKYVDNQSGTPRPGQDLIQTTSPFTGDAIFIDPTAITLIQAAIFASGPTDANGFLKQLGVTPDQITNGWQTFDPVKALSTLTTGERDFTLDNTQTRGAKFKNIAAYFMANFSYLDDRLKGDIGVRYVHTKVDTTGYAGATFAFDPQGQGRLIDPIYLNTLRNSSHSNTCPVLSETPSPLGMGPASVYWTGNGANPADFNDGTNYNLPAFTERNRQARIDGLGTSPAVPGGICYDPLLEQGALPGAFSERNLIRYSDLSTEQFGTIGGNTLTDHSRASVAASDSYEYDVFLPSFNVSYAATNTLIARLSAYKTMSRPPIDDLRAGFRMTEGNIFEGNPIFRTGSKIDLYTAQIKPLVAGNVDLAAEWYFQRDSLLSVNLFYKDIKDLIETRDTRWYIGDLRRIASDPAGATVDGLTFTNSAGVTTDLLQTSSLDVNAQPDIANCMPRRLQSEAVLTTAASWMYSGDARLLCDEYNVSARVNTGSATVKGVELQYVQNYTFLPGFWSGLGVAANYTYQQSDIKGSDLPITGTPEESYNVTAFWEKNGNQIRLAYSGNSDSLIQGSFAGGAAWQAGRQTWDLSAAYKINNDLTLTLDGQNLTDAPVRTYFTSRIIRLPDSTGAMVNFDEGSAFDGAPKSRTLMEYNTGRVFRVGMRMNF
ncbi:MAG: TonB-dependent receptor [Asticcacaulis sp.]